jgi:hypothetical protein
MTLAAAPDRFVGDYAAGVAARAAGLALDDFPRGDPAAAYYWRLGWRGNVGVAAAETAQDRPRARASLYLYPDVPTPRPRRSRANVAPNSALRAEIVAQKAAARREASKYGRLVARALRGTRGTNG